MTLDEPVVDDVIEFTWMVTLFLCLSAVRLVFLLVFFAALF